MKSFGLEFNFGIDYVDHELEITHVTKTDDQEQKSFSMKELSRSDTCKILGTLLCSIWQFQNSPIRGLDDYWSIGLNRGGEFLVHDENTHRDIERFLVEKAKSLNKQFFFVTQEEFNNDVINSAKHVPNIFFDYEDNNMRNDNEAASINLETENEKLITDVEEIEESRSDFKMSK